VTSKPIVGFAGFLVALCGIGALIAPRPTLADAVPPSDLPPALRELLSKQFKFSPSELMDLEREKVVARRLGGSAAGEVGTAGAVRVRARKQTFVDLYRNIVEFKRGPEVVSIGLFGDPPSVSDLASLVLDKQDVNLRNCRVGECDIRLPAATIGRFQREIEWTAPDADARAAALYKQILADNVRAYMSGGAGRMTEYDDEKRPVHPVDDFAGLLKNSPFLDDLVPGLSRHLAAFPSSRLHDDDDFVYWSKEKFGDLAPFVTVTHVTIAHPGAGTAVIASRDVYSSRYFNASLSVTIASDALAAPDAFYLVYVNRSRADALKGAFAGLRRSLVERRAKSSLEDNLKLTKRRLEKSTR